VSRKRLAGEREVLTMAKKKDKKGKDKKKKGGKKK
jgi:hypothetical protein